MYKNRKNNMGLTHISFLDNLMFNLLLINKFNNYSELSIL